MVRWKSSVLNSRVCVYLQGICCHSRREVARDVHYFEEHPSQTSGGDAETGKNVITLLQWSWKCAFSALAASVHRGGWRIISTSWVSPKTKNDCEDTIFCAIHSIIFCERLNRITNTLGAICGQTTTKSPEPFMTASKWYQMLSKLKFNSNWVTFRLNASNPLRFNTRVKPRLKKSQPLFFSTYIFSSFQWSASSAMKITVR